jgi:hypothetical protein
VIVAGNYAYIGVGPRLVVLELSDPANPRMVGQTDMLPDLVEDIHIAGDYAYVADGGIWSDDCWCYIDPGLRVVDISDPTTPVEVATYETPGPAQGVFVVGDHAYVTDTSALWIVDVSNPTTPQYVGFYDTPTSVEDIHVLPTWPPGARGSG